MINDKKYGYFVGDIVYVSYDSDVPAGFYEVSAINPMWIKHDGDGSYNSLYHNFGKVKLICIADNREDL